MFLFKTINNVKNVVLLQGVKNDKRLKYKYLYKKE